MSSPPCGTAVSPLMQTRTTLAAADLDGADMAYDPRLPFQRRTLPDGYGAILRTARETAGSTRREVAEAVGIRPRTLARIERGQQKPLWATLNRLCDQLGVSTAVVAKRWLNDSFDVPSSPHTAPGIGLRALRRARGMTLVELSALSGVSAATLSRFERGLTASRLLGGRVGHPDIARDDSDVVLDSDAVAAAFGLDGSASLRAACLAALASELIRSEGDPAAPSDGRSVAVTGDEA